MSANNNPFWLGFLPKALQSRLHGRVDLFKILHNSWWLILDKVFKAFATMVIGAWVARYLGPSDYGKLAYVLAVVAFFQVITNLGLEGIVVREISQRESDVGEILGTTFLMRFIVGVISWVGLVIFMIITYGFNNENMWLALFIGGSLIFQSVDTIDLWFQSLSQSRRTVLAKFFALTISTSFRIILILIKAPLVYFAVAFGLEFAITALALFLSYQKFKCNQSWKFSFRKRGMTLLSESWPLIISSISITLYSRIDQVLIRNFLGESELGIYSAVILLSTGWYFVPAILYTSLLPSMTKIKSLNEEIYLNRLSKMFRFFIVISLAISIITCFQSENLIRLIYGDRFIKGAKVLSIHIFTTIPVFLGMGAGLWIIIERKTKLILLQTTVGAILSVLANFLLIPLFGIVGAALSSLIVLFSVSVLTNFVVERKLFFLQLGINKLGQK